MTIHADPAQSGTPKPSDVVIETATAPSLAAPIAEIAAVTFPLACPPHSTPADIAAHIDQVLSAERFAEYLADPDQQVLIARSGPDGEIIGYALLVHTAPANPDARKAISNVPAGAEAIAAQSITEVSKMYVVPEHHAVNSERRPAHLLMDAALDAAKERGSTYVWLGVHSGNERAKKYYAKMGYRQIGQKTFNMNGVIEHDYVLGRELT